MYEVILHPEPNIVQDVIAEWKQGLVGPRRIRERRITILLCRIASGEEEGCSNRCFRSAGGLHPISALHIRECLLMSHRALYPRGDPYESSDPVFGVKESLVVDLSTVTDPEMAKKYSVKEGTHLLTYDFVLVTMKESLKLRKEEAIKAIQKMGKNVEDFQGLPILDVD